MRKRAPRKVEGETASSLLVVLLIMLFEDSLPSELKCSSMRRSDGRTDGRTDNTQKKWPKTSATQLIVRVSSPSGVSSSSTGFRSCHRRRCGISTQAGVYRFHHFLQRHRPLGAHQRHVALRRREPGNTMRSVMWRKFHLFWIKRVVNMEGRTTLTAVCRWFRKWRRRRGRRRRRTTTALARRAKEISNT